MKKEYKVVAVGGAHDGETVKTFAKEVDTINYCYEHADDHPLGYAIFDGDGKEIINW